MDYDLFSQMTLFFLATKNKSKCMYERPARFSPEDRVEAEFILKITKNILYFYVH